MDQITTIKQSIEGICLDQGISIYDICWTHEGKHKILQIALMREDGSMDIDTCADMAQLIGDKLDELDLIPYEYMLEVCSPGAERVLRNLDEVKKEINQYIYAKLKKPAGKLAEVKGTLLSVDGNECLIEYMDKAVKKKITVDYDNIALIRLSVKI